MANIFSGLFSNIKGVAGQSASSTGIGSQYINQVSTGTGILRTSAGTGVLTAPPPPYYSRLDEAYQALSTLENYVTLCGDKLEVIRLSKTIETKDPKISMLKLLKEGEFLKNVGLKFDEHTYYVIREQE